MSLVQPISRAVYELYPFATFSPDNFANWARDNKDDIEHKAITDSIFGVLFITSPKLTLMTELFHRVGPLVKSPLLATWKHATILAWKPVALVCPGRMAWILPYQSVFLFGFFLAVVYLGYHGKPEFPFANRKIYIIDTLIKAVEITSDAASTVSAVALIILGQPITGGCVLVFIVIQIAGRAGIFHEPLKPKKSKTLPLNADTPPWLVRDSKKIQSVWLELPQGYRNLALKQDYFWVVKHVGCIAGVVAAPEKMVALRILQGLQTVFVSPYLKEFIHEIVEEQKRQMELLKKRQKGNDEP